MDWAKIKTGLVGALLGAGALAFIAFKSGGVVTSGAAEDMAAETAEVAVVDRLTPICIVQFNQDSQKNQKLKKLKKTKSWDRGDYVKKQGWATMPGEKEADSKVAEKCAVSLVESGQ